MEKMSLFYLRVIVIILLTMVFTLASASEPAENGGAYDYPNYLVQLLSVQQVLSLEYNHTEGTDCSHNVTTSITAGSWFLGALSTDAHFRMESYCSSTGYLIFDVMKQHRFDRLLVFAWPMANGNDTNQTQEVQLDDCFVQRNYFVEMSSEPRQRCVFAEQDKGRFVWYPIDNLPTNSYVVFFLYSNLLGDSDQEYYNENYEELQTVYHNDPVMGYKVDVVFEIYTFEAESICATSDEEQFEIVAEMDLERELEQWEHLWLHSYEYIYQEHYDLCTVIMHLHAFQPRMNGNYSLVISSSGIAQTNFISYNISLHVDYDAFNSNFVSFRINTPEFGVMVLQMAWVLGKLNAGQSLLDRVNQITDACTALNKPVLTLQMLEMMQAEGANDFIETVMYANFMVGRDYNFDQWDFIFMQPVYQLYCGSISPENNTFDYKLCTDDQMDTIVAVFCAESAGLIQNIQIVFDSCSNESCSELDNGDLDITFLVKADMADVGAKRTLDCFAKTINSLTIRSSKQNIEVESGKYAKYNFVIRPEEIVTLVICEAFETVYATNKKVSATFAFPEYSPLFEFYSPFNEEVDEDTIIYLEDSVYGSSVDLYAEIYLYPTSYDAPFSLYFQEFMETEYKVDFTNFVTRLICGRNSIRKNYFMEVKVEANYSIESFDVVHTGKYTYRPNIEWVDDSNKIVAIELIHPFSVECQESCLEPLIGHPLMVSCSLSSHVITENTMQEAELPLNIVLNKEESADDVYDTEVLPCEVNIPLDTTLKRTDLYEVRTSDKEVSIRFEFFNIQPWIEGNYYVSVEMPTLSNCFLIGKNETDCLWTGHEQNSDRRIDSDSKTNRFSIQLQKSFGAAIPAYITESCGSIHPKSFYFLFNTTAQDLNISDADYFNNFYRFCRTSSSELVDVESICSEDGGVVVTNDDLSTLIDPEAAFDTSKAWKSMICQANSKWHHMSFTGNSATEVSFYFLTLDSAGDVKSFRFDRYSYKAAVIGSAPETKNKYVFCKYQRGKIWKIKKMYSDCQYVPLTSSGVFNETLTLETIGDLPVDVYCFPGNYTEGNITKIPEQENTESRNRQFFYSSSPKLILVNKITHFHCEQVSNEFEGDFEKFTFPFSASYKPLKVVRRIKPVKLWTTPEDSDLRQPGYGETATLSTCVEGNPIDWCEWVVRRITIDGVQPEQIIVNGTQGYSFNLTPDEVPQCNNTKSCSFLSIDNLDMDLHDGFYSFRCFAGFENEKGEFVGDSHESRLFRIVGEQSAPVGFNPISYSLNCETGQLDGEIAIYGQPVTANIYCRAKDESYYEVQFNETRETQGYTLFKFFPPAAEEGLICKYTGSNIYTRRPLTVEAEVSTIAQSFQLRNAVPYLEGRHAFCCDVCGIGVDSSHIRIKCVLDPNAENSKEMLRFTTSSGYDKEKAKYSQCETLIDPVFRSVFCSCRVSLLPDIESSLVFYGNGEIAEKPPITKMPISYNDNIFNFTTPLWNTEIATESTTTSKTTTTSSGTTTTKPEVSFIKVQRSLDVVEKKIVEGIGLQELANELRSLTKSLNSITLTNDNLDEVFNPLVKIAHSLKISHGDVEPTETELYKLGSDLMQQTCELISTILAKSPPVVKKNESRVLAMVEIFEKALHRIFANVGPNMSFLYKSPKLKAFVWRLGEVHPYMKDKSLSLDFIDMNGVTKHYKQVGKISAEDLELVPENSTVILAFYDHNLIDIGGSKYSQYQKSKDGKELRVVKHTRVADFFSASIADPDVEIIDTIGVNFTLGFIEGQLLSYSDENFRMGLKHSCVYFNHSSNSYHTDGLEEVQMGHSEASCSSSHMTLFSVKAVESAVKFDNLIKLPNHTLAYIGIIPAFIILLIVFNVLLYLHEFLDLEENLLDLYLCVSAVGFLSSYMIFADKVEEGQRAECRVGKGMITFWISSHLGVMLNYAANVYRRTNMRLISKRINLFWHSICIAVVPGTLAVLVSTFDSVFSSPRPYCCIFASNQPSAISVYGVIVLFYVTSMILAGLSIRNSENLFKELGQEAIDFNLMHNINCCIYITNTGTAIILFTIFMMNSNDNSLYGLFSFLVICWALFLAYFKIYSRKELLQVGWSGIHEPIRKKKPRTKKKAQKQRYTVSEYLENFGIVPTASERVVGSAASFQSRSSFNTEDFSDLSDFSLDGDQFRSDSTLPNSRQS